MTYTDDGRARCSHINSAGARCTLGTHPVGPWLPGDSGHMYDVTENRPRQASDSPTYDMLTSPFLAAQ